MNDLPTELVSHILLFLSVPDRKEAALVSKRWYEASLHPLLQKDMIVKCKPLHRGSKLPIGLIKRKLTHLELGDWDSRLITEYNFVKLLRKCPTLVELDLTDCNTLFLSGRLLERESDVHSLKRTLVNVKDLKLGCLRHINDITFKRLVSVLDNVEKISIASTNMIFGSDLCSASQNSPAMLHFSTFLNYVEGHAEQLKSIDLSHTSLPDEALLALANIEGLELEELSLQGCTEITNKGVMELVTIQRSLQILNISGCKEVGSNKSFFLTVADNLLQLHTLNMRKCVSAGEGDIAALSEMRSLKVLDLGEVLNLFDAELIKGLCSEITELSSLSLPFCPEIQDQFIFRLCKTNYTLVHLDLSSCLKLTDSSVLYITRTLTLLRTLRLRYCHGITDLGVLGYAPENGAVARHAFDHDHEGCSCTREHESKIFRKPTGKIKEHQSSISKALTSLEKGEKEEMQMLSNLDLLHTLDLSSCSRITDVGISEAVRFRELRCLLLSGLPKIKDPAIIAVAHHNPSLEEIDLSHCVNLTDESVIALVKHCPRLHTLKVASCSALTDNCLQIIGMEGKRLRIMDMSFCNFKIESVASLESVLPNLNVLFRPHYY